MLFHLNQRPFFILTKNIVLHKSELRKSQRKDADLEKIFSIEDLTKTNYRMQIKNSAVNVLMIHQNFYISKGNKQNNLKVGVMSVISIGYGTTRFLSNSSNVSHYKY